MKMHYCLRSVHIQQMAEMPEVRRRRAAGATVTLLPHTNVLTTLALHLLTIMFVLHLEDAR